MARILFLLWLPLPAASLAGADTFAQTDGLWRLLLLSDYNTRVVVLGTLLFGAGAGLVGVFLLLRKRALFSDAASHATLPGIVLAFLLLGGSEGGGKSLPILLLGATATAIAGMLSVIAIRRFSRLKDDAALGIVLSVYFGIGIALLGVATRLETGTAAGLSSFIYGKTASMLYLDALLIGGVALVVLASCGLLFKELALLCFDSDFAASQGWPVLGLDVLLMLLVVAVTVIGLSAVGLILVVAMLVIPPAAARFWTHDLRAMLAVSGVIGAASGGLGAAASALLENLPAGAVIVLVAGGFFLISLLFGAERGLLARHLVARRLQSSVEEQHLLRALYERLESGLPPAPEAPDVSPSALRHQSATLDELLSSRSWSPRQLARAMRRAARKGLLLREADRLAFTPAGLDEARRMVRNHRLWELFLITHADTAPGQVDHEADRIEHVLGPEMIAELEALLPQAGQGVPESAHALPEARSLEGASP